MGRARKETMKTSESIKHIAPALLAAQKQMTFAAKDSTNPHFKNKYAGLPQVIDAIKGPLNDNGITFIQTPTIPEIDDVRLLLVTRLLHESGEWIEDTAICPMPKQDPQGLGSAMTYLRRYSLAAICGLYQDDDDGEMARFDTEPYAKKLRDSKSMDELKEAWIAAMTAVNKVNDKQALRILEAEKDKRKKELSEEVKS
jgi:ERF superfamily